MKFYRGVSLVGLSAVSLALMACSPDSSKPVPQAKASHQAPPGTYRCESANDKGKNWVSIAKERDIARGEALTQCHQSSKNPESCHIASCTWKGPQPYPAQSQGKFTCYAKNHKVSGVWTATALDQNKAIAHSMSRCHAHSGAPKACYFEYCRNW